MRHRNIMNIAVCHAYTSKRHDVFNYLHQLCKLPMSDVLVTMYELLEDDEISRDQINLVDKFIKEHKFTTSNLYNSFTEFIKNRYYYFQRQITPWMVSILNAFIKMVMRIINL